MANDFKKLERAFHAYKKKAGDPAYAACFGKTFLDVKEKEYQLARGAVKLLVEHGFAVLHGSYTGAMQAASEGAIEAIAADPAKNAHWNIGVPLKLFDAHWKRCVQICLPAAEDIHDRKKALSEFCDLCVVLPSGGFGTLLEALEVFHMNQLTQRFGGTVRPIIFFGRRWKMIFACLVKWLDLRKQEKGERWTYFVGSLDELEAALILIKRMKRV